jgi:cytochrome c2
METTMAENTEHSDDKIKQEATDSVKRGDGVRERVRDLTLGALTSRRFNRDEIREVVRAITEGASRGVEGGGAASRQSLAEAFRGMDQALTKAVEAGQQAIRQLVGTGRGLSERELQQALSGLRKIEEDFISTVSEVAESASERVGPDLKEVVGRATRAGTDTGRQTAAAVTEFTQRMAGASVELTLSGIELAGEFGTRFAQIASGMLAGVADVLDKDSTQKKNDR